MERNFVDTIVCPPKGIYTHLDLLYLQCETMWSPGSSTHGRPAKPPCLATGLESKMVNIQVGGDGLRYAQRPLQCCPSMKRSLANSSSSAQRRLMNSGDFSKCATRPAARIKIHDTRYLDSRVPRPIPHNPAPYANRVSSTVSLKRFRHSQAAHPLPITKQSVVSRGFLWPEILVLRGLRPRPLHPASAIR